MLMLMLMPMPMPMPRFSAVRAACLAGETSDAGILFREKLLYLQDLSVDPHKALRMNPSLRAAPVSSVVSVEACLSSAGLSRPAVGRILDMFPDLLTSDPESDILPVIRFLSDEISIAEKDIPKSISRCPRLLISSVDLQLRPAFTFLKTLGFVGRDTITSRNTLLLVSSVDRTLIPKLDYLQQGLGFTREQVAKMVVRSPALLTYSVHNNLAPKLDFFLDEMRADVKELQMFPQYFSFSLERKIKPRYRLLKEHRISMPLSEMLKVSDGHFHNWLFELRLRIIRKNDAEFAKKLAALTDVYVNDAFGIVHRAHASTEGVDKYVKPSVVGFIMQKELDYLVGDVANLKKPFDVIVGGLEVSTKTSVIELLPNSVDILLLGGDMIFNFYKAQSHSVGFSLVEEDKLDLAKSLMEKAKPNGVSPPDRCGYCRQVCSRC